METGAQRDVCEHTGDTLWGLPGTPECVGVGGIQKEICLQVPHDGVGTNEI